MNQEDFNKLYKMLDHKLNIERPTYLGHFQAFKSLILNIKDDRIFIKKRVRKVSALKYEKNLHENRYVFEIIINMYYLIYICEGSDHEKFGLPGSLKRQERERITLLINWILQGQLTKHRERVVQITKMDFTGKLDLSKTVHEFLSVNEEKDQKIHQELKTFNQRVASGMADELLVRKFIELEKKYWGYFSDIKKFKLIYSDLKKVAKDMFEKQIYFGYKDSIPKDMESDYAIPYIYAFLLEDYLFYIGLDNAFWRPNEYYQRMENIYSTYEKSLTYMIEFFENEVSEDIGPVDVALMLSPLITFQKNLDLHMKQYKKKLSTNIKKGSQKRKDYERIWIRELYKDIKKDCEGKNVRYKKEYDEILYEIMYHIGLVFDEFNVVCQSQFNRAEYSMENLKKMTRGL